MFEEYTTKAAPKRKRTSSMYLSSEERRELIQSIGDSGVVLMQYYFEKAGVPNFEYTDEKSAKALGWTERKAKDIRLKLTKLGWFAQATGKLSNGNKHVVTYLGKETVRQYSSATELTSTTLRPKPMTLDEAEKYLDTQDVSEDMKRDVLTEYKDLLNQDNSG